MTNNLKSFESITQDTTSKTSYIPSNQRHILCIFPKHSRSFGTFHHAYPLMGSVKAFMPPQGILIVASYLPKTWEVRLKFLTVKLVSLGLIYVKV